MTSIANTHVLANGFSFDSLLAEAALKGDDVRKLRVPSILAATIPVAAALTFAFVTPDLALAGGLPPVDLSITLTDGPDPVGAHGFHPVSTLVYRVTVANPSDDTASDVVVRVPIPALAAAAPSLAPGCYLVFPGYAAWECPYAQLAPHSEIERSFTLSVFADAPALLAPAPATVVAANPDPNIANNSAAVTTTVWPTLSANCALLVHEGDAGTRPFPCYAYLRGPRDAAVTTGYTTVPVTATPGIDYLPTSGTLKFPPGTGYVSLSFDVPVVGDTRPEGMDTFRVSLIPAHGAFVADIEDAWIFDDDDPSPPAGLTHGARIRGDLASSSGDRRVAFFAVPVQENDSYELVADEVTGDAGDLHIGVRTNTFPPGVLHSQPVGTGGAVSVRFTGTQFTSDVVWVEGLGCGNTCGPDDTYRLRLYETTLRAPRFNRSGGQDAVIVLQNTSDLNVTGGLHFWSESGVERTIDLAPIPPHGVFVRRIADLVPDPPSGSVTVTHDAPYGKLLGKVMTFDPLTGFSFDSLLLPKPR